MAKFTLAHGLDQKVAQMIVPEVDNVIDRTTKTAKSLAPPTKQWQTVGDGKVRHSHRGVNRTTIPDNLRFSLQAFLWDTQHPQLGGVAGDLGGNNPAAPKSAGGALAASSTYLLEPRDRSGEHFVQITSCRCRVERDPQGIARLIGSNSAKAKGTIVRGKVFAAGPGVYGAEYGDEYPMPSGVRKEPGTRFMRNTVMAMRLVV